MPVLCAEFGVHVLVRVRVCAFDTSCNSKNITMGPCAYSSALFSRCARAHSMYPRTPISNFESASSASRRVGGGGGSMFAHSEFDICVYVGMVFSYISSVYNCALG